MKNNITGNAFSNCDTYYYFIVTESIISAPLQENNAMVQTLSPRNIKILKKVVPDPSDLEFVDHIKEE